jgi:hypothetical protein
MCLLGAAGDEAPVCADARLSLTKTDFIQLPGAALPGDSLSCGQSRTTIRARVFASLIGRLWAGGC